MSGTGVFNRPLLLTLLPHKYTELEALCVGGHGCGAYMYSCVAWSLSVGLTISSAARLLPCTAAQQGVLSTALGGCEGKQGDRGPALTTSPRTAPGPQAAGVAHQQKFPNSQYRSTDLFQEPRQILLYNRTS
eukprot:COSAG01_NODE_36686_length_513_cov_22.026570_1_plen_132_part_00